MHQSLPWRCIGQLGEETYIWSVRRLIVIWYLCISVHLYRGKSAAKHNVSWKRNRRMVIIFTRWITLVIGIHIPIPIHNINWRDVQTKNVVNYVDMSCLRAPRQNGPYKNQHKERHKHSYNIMTQQTFLCFSERPTESRAK